MDEEIAKTPLTMNAANEQMPNRSNEEVAARHAEAVGNRRVFGATGTALALEPLITADEVAGFKKGAKATMTIVPAAAPDQKVALDISLKGFTAGYDAVAASLAQ